MTELLDIKANLTKKIFSNILKKQSKKYNTEIALVIESDKDYIQRLYLLNADGYISDDTGKNKVYKLSSLLNAFDLIELEGLKVLLGTSFSLEEEINKLIKKYCEEFKINPLSLNIIIMFSGNEIKIYMYNGSVLVKEIKIEELF